MTLIDIYILKKIFSSFFFTVLIIVSVVCIIDVTEKNDKYVSHELSISEIAYYYLAFFPYVTNIIFPITVFIAIVFVTSRLASHTEIIAILSSGVSFQRLMGSYMLGGVILAVLNFVMHAYIIPISNKPRIKFEIQYLKRSFYFSDQDVHIKIGKNSYLYLESYNNHSKTGYNITLETIEGNQLKEKLTAKQITWIDSTNTWQLKDWNARVINEFGEKYTTGEQQDTVLTIVPKDFESQYMLYESFTLNELDEYIDELRNRGADDVMLYEIEKYLRYTYPFAVLILTFIGVTVSARKVRGGTGFQIALGFLLAFILIIFFMFSRAIAEKGIINPLLAVWIPNIIFAVIGLFMYKMIPK